MIEDDQDFHLQTNKASLNPFECSEMMGTIKGRSSVSSLDWPSQTKTYLINLGARNLVFYIKIMNSVALFLGDTLEKSLRLQGHYFPYLRLFWHRR